MTEALFTDNKKILRQKGLLYMLSTPYSMLLAGLLFPLGFSPYNIPGFTFLSLAFYYAHLTKQTPIKALFSGFFYGLGLFGFGVSWIIISIHDYGLLNYFLSGLITLLFVSYLSCYPALVNYLFKLFACEKPLSNAFLFSALWILGESLRSSLMSGFPWLLLGVSQINTPLQYLSPLLGQQALGFLACLAATLLVNGLQLSGGRRHFFIISFVLLLILPEGLKSFSWTKLAPQPISVAVIQPNLSMRDKWDESLFWKLLQHYQETTDQLLGHDLIVMPESAIPLPESYVEAYLTTINDKANAANTAILSGILQAANPEETRYNNAIITLGKASGQYAKRHLVPFGEYIPDALRFINRWFSLPDPGLIPGKARQALLQVGEHPVASLICYEIAYPELLRQQMPEARWIISVSDNGWFGHSLASYQQIQMAQMLSLQTGRYQVVANNDGLSSVINEKGRIVNSLPPFSAGILNASIYGASGTTPWMWWGDYPVLLFCSVVILYRLLRKNSH